MSESSEAQAAAAPQAAPQEVPDPGSEEFARLLDQHQAAAGQEAKAGDKVSGVLVKIGPEDSFVDFGGRSEGRIKTSELHDPEGKQLFQVGEPLEAFVVDDQAEILLTRFLHQQDHGADKLYQAYKAGIPVEGKVKTANKWGLGVEIQGVNAFCPISQIDLRYVEDPQAFRDQVFQFKILRYRDQGRNIVVSRRALLEQQQQQQADQARARIAEGAQLEGRVTRLEPFGAFVDLGGGVEGMVHVSELSHERVNHPDELLQEGQQLTVAVLKIKDLGDRKKERISLSLKALQGDPWTTATTRLTPGTVVQGKVEAIENYGAFVGLEGNVRGLVHVSELAEKRVANPRDVVAIGQEVRVVVLEVDARRKRLRLSLKQVDTAQADTDLREFQQRQKKQEAQIQGSSAMMEALKRAQLIE